MQIPDINNLNIQQGLAMPTGSEWIVLIIIFSIPVIVIGIVIYSILLWIKIIKLKNKMLEKNLDKSNNSK